MELIKNIQTIVQVLFEHKLQVVIIITLISCLNIFFNIVVLNNSKNNINNEGNKKE